MRGHGETFCQKIPKRVSTRIFVCLILEFNANPTPSSSLILQYFRR